MEALFKDGEIITVAKRWLEDTHSTQLQMANAALIIANLARSGRYARDHYVLYILRSAVLCFRILSLVNSGVSTLKLLLPYIDRATVGQQTNVL